MLGLSLWGMLSFGAMFAIIVALAIGAAMLGWGSDQPRTSRVRPQRSVRLGGSVVVDTGRSRAAL